MASASDAGRRSVLVTLASATSSQSQTLPYQTASKEAGFISAAVVLSGVLPFAANEAMAIGWGGISLVSRATGLARQVISAGIKELQEGQRAGEGRIRRIGGGRKSTVSKDPRMREDLERLVEPVTRGDPESPLRWTSKSVRKLAKELQHLGHQVSHELVSELLHELGYSLQALRKTREGGEHPDRDGQFEHLNAQAAASLSAGEPAVSVDAKKKELVGDFKNPGRA